MLEGEKLETNSNFKVCLRRAGKIESHEILCLQEEYQRLEQILFGTVQAAENSSPQPKTVLEDQLLWEKDLAKKCKRPPFASIEQAANNYQCLCNEIYKRIRSLTVLQNAPCVDVRTIGNLLVIYDKEIAKKAPGRFARASVFSLLSSVSGIL